MAKPKIKKIGVKMMVQGTEWVVTSPIPVYGWESEYVFVNGKRTQRASRQKVQLRVIPAGVTIRVLAKPLQSWYGVIVSVTVIGETTNDLNIELADLVKRVTPAANGGRYHVFCKNRQKYYEGWLYVRIDRHNYRLGSSYQEQLSDAPSTGFQSLTQAREFALVHMGEAESNPQNGNCFHKYNQPENLLAGDIVIVRTHLLTNAVLDEHPVIV